MPVSTRSAPRKRRRKRARRRRRLLLFLLLAAAAGLLIFSLRSGSPSLPESPEQSEETEPTETAQPQTPPETPDWITADLLPVNPYSRPGTALTQVNGIVIHYVGNPGTTAQNNRDYFAGLAETGERSASSHFVIGLEGEIIQCVPLDEIAYCSNQRNGDTISIECCHPDEEGKFNQTTYDSLVKLVVWLTDYYELDRDQVIRHYDVTGKLCPIYYVEHEDAWEQFKDDVFGEDSWLPF